MKSFIFILILVPLTSHSQNIDWGPFEHLLNKTWSAEGSWGDSSRFKQSIHFSYDLNKQIIIANADGYTNQGQTQFGKRNHGIRKYDKEQDKYIFWEYDVFGGVTQGEIILKDKDIIYHYQYGESVVTDMWHYINDSTYQFIVGNYKNNVWQQKYLETTFHLEEDILARLSSALSGKWVSPAWNGSLEEEWHLSDNTLVQQSIYSEGGKVLYESKSYIEKKAGELLLTSVIKDSNPKIFKATDISDDRIIFENSDYTNPSKVTYFIEGDRFNRKIEGTEDGVPTSYTFKFTHTKM